MKFINKIVSAFNTAATTWTAREWMVLTGVMLVVGIICMQGYGSRKSI